MGEIITDSNHEPIELKGVFQDVTSLKKVEISLKESRENYRLLFESLPVGLAISDNKGKILYGNRKSRLLLGITRSELKQGVIDLNHWKFIRKDGLPVPLNELPNIRANIENRMIENNEIGIIRDNEKVTWLNVTAALLPDQSNILIAFIDISDKIEREKQLQELSDKLSELNATKDKFFSIIAHDLKNPFNSILGFSELLMKNLKKYSAEEIERFTGIINSTSQSAYNLL
ncbi:MAG: PAS domain S-box protein, partial [Bacteroidetes bacterium]|nr:PAS domain S-box protein [Bacteroidota bacterium]